MFKIEKCCCLSLPTAALIIAWINIVTSSGNIITGVYGISNIDQYIMRYTSDFEESLEDQRLAYEIGFATLIVISVIRLTASVCLVIGASKRNRFLMIPHLCFEIICLVTVGVIMFAYAVWLIIDINPETFITLIILCTAFAMNVYLYCCVQSLYQKIKEAEENRDNINMQKVIDGLPPYGTLF